MHAIFSPIAFAIFCILLFGVIEIALLRLLNRRWWSYRWIRRAAWSLPITGIFAILFWGLGEYFNQNALGFVSSIILLLVVVAEIALMLSLPISGLVHLLHSVADHWRRRRQAKNPDLPDADRRIFLQTAAAAVPLMTMATGVTGVARSFGDVRLATIPMYFENLPPTLEGFRIWHLSDTHIRHYVTLDDIAELTDRARLLSPHIILITGDVSDDLRQLSPALTMIDALRPPYGTYACLGNHEYFRGIQKVREIYERSPVPLLVDRGIPLNINGSSVYIAAIDDPRSLTAAEPDFFKRTVDSAMRDSRNADFSILMSHRPEALDYASTLQIPLILAGHTHGGQVGFMGKSAFSYLWPDAYLWGLYRKQSTQMYLTCGAGQWFPFRLGCPPEAPIIELHSVKTGESTS
jgi:uncharacterized protein